MAILIPLFVATLTVAAMVFVASPLHYIKKIAKALGFGWITYHSDSQKEFYSLTKRDALEWMAATYDDAIIWDNRTKTTAAIYFALKDRVEFY